MYVVWAKFSEYGNKLIGSGVIECGEDTPRAAFGLFADSAGYRKFVGSAKQAAWAEDSGYTGVVFCMTCGDKTIAEACSYCVMEALKGALTASITISE